HPHTTRLGQRPVDLCTRNTALLQIRRRLVWLPPPSSFLILGLGPAYGRVMVAYNV
ncbi:hypothetical protein BpHYR1_022303, partial [Brachionus plicatilis]